MFRSSKGDIGLLTFLLFLVFLLWIVIKPAKADDIKPAPVFPPTAYSITVSVDEANLLMDIFANSEIAQVKYTPLLNSIKRQIGVQNDAASLAFKAYSDEQNKKSVKK